MTISNSIKSTIFIFLFSITTLSLIGCSSTTKDISFIGSDFGGRILLNSGQFSKPILRSDSEVNYNLDEFIAQLQEELFYADIDFESFGNGSFQMKTEDKGVLVGWFDIRTNSSQIMLNSISAASPSPSEEISIVRANIIFRDAYSILTNYAKIAHTKLS